MVVVDELLRKLDILGNDLDEISKCLKRIKIIAKNGGDISQAVDYLEEMKYSSPDAIHALMFHHLNNKSWKDAEKLLESGENCMIVDAFNAVLSYARKGKDISGLVSFLKKTLDMPLANLYSLEDQEFYGYSNDGIDPDIQLAAEHSIAYHYLNKGNAKKVVDLFENEYGDFELFVRFIASHENLNILQDKFEKKYHSKLKKCENLEEKLDLQTSMCEIFLETSKRRCRISRKNQNDVSVEKTIRLLESFESSLEKTYAELSKKDLANEKINLKVQISGMSSRISHIKAELSRNEGEILTGETIKPPKEKDGRKYKELRRCRHG